MADGEEVPRMGAPMEGMRIIAVDDEALVLADLMRALEREALRCALRGFSMPDAALAFAREHAVDAAFCDIEMPGMNGIAFAKALKDIHPDAHIVFVTSYEHYMRDAFAIHATGYLLKPVDSAELRRELAFIHDHIPHREARRRVEVATFGGFEVKVDGAPLVFKRSKSKELFALLVDRRGAGISGREACDALWEGEPYGASQRSYYQTIAADLRSTLVAAGVGDILVKAWNSLAINPDAIDCDLYRFLEGDSVAVNAYRGSYLPAYAWAEFSIGGIERAWRRR